MGSASGCWAWPAALLLLVGCADHVPPFSDERFRAAKARCRAPGAYRIAAAPGAIGFRGTSDDHFGQARRLEAELAGTDARVVLVGSRRF